MNRLNSILTATDLSKPARLAVERTAMIVRDQDVARFDLLHVVSKTLLSQVHRLLSGTAEKLERQLIADAKQVLHNLASDLSDRFGVSANPLVKTGGVLEEMVSAAEESAADMIVLGARGAHYVREFVLGTTTERMIRKTTKPLLAVKQFPDGPYRRVLVPVDFSLYSRPALELASVVAPGAAISLLHAYEAPFERKLLRASVSERAIRSYRAKAQQQAQLDMEALVANISVPGGVISRQVEHGVANYLILESEQELGADLIVMGKHGESLTEELLLGSVTKHILAYSNCDVLIASRALE